MLWNKDFLFLHYPKTAGKSLSLAFAEVWPRPIYGFVSKGQIAELSGVDQDGLHLTVARGHENIKEAKSILADAGIDIYQLKAIFIGVRNPYDLMVSNYFFMRKTYARNTERPNFQLAMENDFESYCEKIPMQPPRVWMELDGAEPPNLSLIRYEHLQSDFDAAAKRFGFPTVRMPHLNSSDHDTFERYLSPKSEERIYSIFSDMFDRGLYERVDLGSSSD